MVTLWREGAGGGFEASARCDTKCVVRGLAALPGGGFAQVGTARVRVSVTVSVTVSVRVRATLTLTLTLTLT